MTTDMIHSCCDPAQIHRNTQKTLNNYATKSAQSEFIIIIRPRILTNSEDLKSSLAISHCLFVVVG